MNSSSPEARLSTRRFDSIRYRGFYRWAARFSAALCTIAVFLFSSPALLAQAATGTVTGQVQDDTTGKYVEGAEVTITGTELRTITSRDGTFIISNVPAGPSTVSISYVGLETKDVAVVVEPNQSVPVVARLNSDIVKLSTFTVTTMREGMAQAVALQKMSVQSKVVVAADQFGPISEGNVGEYLKFLPGVSIDYNVNDARGVSLRGLSTAFTIVAVDGTPMAGASSIDLTRRFEFEQIAMNNVETTELFKTVTPDIAANATGGYVNFVTKSAFDSADVQRISYDLSFGGPGSNFKFSKQGGVWGNQKEYPIRPSLEVNFSRKISEKVGINLNYRYSDKYDDAPRTIEAWTLAGTTPSLTSYTVQDEQKLTHRESLAAKVDFRLSDSTELFVAGSWNNYDLLFTQRGLVFNLGSNPTITGDTVTSGTAGTRNVQNGILQRRKYGDTWHLNSTLKHTFGDESVLRITPYWSLADGYYDDTDFGYISGNSTITYSATAVPFNQVVLSGIYDLKKAPQVSLTPRGTTATPVSYLRDLGNYTYNPSGTAFQSRPWHARDIKSGVNGNYVRDLFKDAFPVKLDAGFAYDNAYRKIFKPDYRGPGVAAITGDTLRALGDGNYNEDVAFGFGPMQAIDPYKLWDAYSTVNMALNNFQSYLFKEDNLAAYARVDVNVTPKFLVVGGVRWEQREISADTETFATPRFSSGETNLKYDDWYPSITFKYTPIKSLVARGGASRTVGHPDYTDLVTSITQETALGANDGSITLADPDLKPYFATNFDVGADYYLGNRGVVGVTFFHKKLTNFISSRSMTAAELAAAAAFLGVDAADYNAGSTTVNGASATYQGFEVSFAQNLTFLPKPFDGLSVQANYSFTDISSSDLDTEYSAKRAVSPEMANLILGYRHGRFNAILTNNWVSESLYGGFVNTSYFAGTGDNRLLRMKEEKWTTDVKLEFSITKYASVYVMARNILNTGRDEYFQGYVREKQNVILPMRYGEFGEPYYAFGIRGTF